MSKKQFIAESLAIVLGLPATVYALALLGLALGY